MAIEVGRAPRPVWSRGYPPLVLLAVAVVVAAFVLPSSLNLPQSNPSTVLEYAPVPPDDDTPPPADDGNVSSLGLGSSGSLLDGGELEPPPPPPPPDEGTGARPTDKRCVGDPPRQSEDPMAPPCVPFFDGDNFGATYQGVTKDEITVLIYIDSGCYNFECPSIESGQYKDLNDEPKPACPKTWPANNPDKDTCDFLPIRIARGFESYFNTRFQTYNRTVRYYMYMTSASTAAGRRKDAADNWEELKPFAVLDQATFSGHNEAYVDAMAARGVLTFTQQTALPGSFFAAKDGLAWGFFPDVEHWADMHTSYLCTKVAGHTVKRFGKTPGQGAPNGEERRFGLYYTTDPGEKGLQLFAKLVREGLEDCGVVPVTEASYPRNGFVTDGGDDGGAQADAVVKFQTADVTTVLWLGGVEGRFSQTADGAGYYPEIVFAGDLDIDNNVTARNQNPNVWQNAWGTHFQLRLDEPEAQPAFRAYRESTPNAVRAEARYANDAYRDHFMLFQAVQVAGPRLNVATVDKGFHAIPEHSSTSPYVASCFFDPGDFTCVKDATEVWWDPTGEPPGGADTGSTSAPKGCYRMALDGERFLARTWEPADDLAFEDSSDPCTGFEGARRLRVS